MKTISWLHMGNTHGMFNMLYFSFEMHYNWNCKTTTAYGVTLKLLWFHIL